LDHTETHNTINSFFEILSSVHFVRINIYNHTYGYMYP